MERTKSTNKVEVVPISLEAHPNADALSVIKIFGYSLVGNTESWKNITQAAYIPPDSLVDTTREEFSFLNDGKSTLYYSDGLSSKEVVRDEPGKYARVRIKKLRGVVSYGLLVPSPANAKLGDDLTEHFGVLHWNPPEPLSTGGEVAKGPNVFTVKYDVDSFQRYAKDVFVENELVQVSEKIHGANARYVYHNGEFHCGSRTEWKKEFPTPPSVDEIEKQMREKIGDKISGEELEKKISDMRAKISGRTQPQNIWWKGLNNTVGLKEWLEANTSMVVYGELYGAVKGFPYDTEQGKVKVAVFDIMQDGKWLDSQTARAIGDKLPWVPSIITSFNFDKLIETAEGKTVLGLGKHIKEGVVVKPIKERRHEEIGRVQLKIVSKAYLEK